MNIEEKRNQAKDNARQAGEIISRRGNEMSEIDDLGKEISQALYEEVVKVNIEKQKSAQQLILEGAAQQVKTQTHSETKLNNCYGEILDLMARHRHTRIMPDEFAALAQFAYHFASQLTSPHYDQETSLQGVSAFAAAGDMAINGYQASLDTAIKGRMG